MRISSYILVVFLILVVGLGYSVFRRFQAVEFGERVTMYFSTPNGPVVAQNVFQRRHWMIPIPLGNERAVYSRGAAIVIDFGDAGLAFGMLDDGRGTIAYNAYPELYKKRIGSGRVHKSRYFRRIKGQAGEPPREIKMKYQPVLVQFGDVGDPSTMRFLDSRDLFGPERPGYMLEKVTVEITLDEPDFESVRTMLPAVKVWDDAHFATYQDTLPDNIPRIYGLKKFNERSFIIEEFAR